jgi:cyclic beta-1,2-glucan synthetase
MWQHELFRLLPQLPPASRAMLDSGRAAVAPPIRAEIFGPQRFAQHGRSLADTHQAQRARSAAAAFFPRLRHNIRVLREAHQHIGEQATTGYDISPAAEWLLDNFHLIEAQLKEIHEGLPHGYFRALPTLAAEPLAGLPRVYGVAWAFVAHTDSAFDEDLLAAYLGAYQEVRELQLAEMWALPTTLRVVLVENLRRLAERMATNKAAREVANLVCDDLERWREPLLDELLAMLGTRGVGPVFLAQVAQRLQDRHGPDDERCRAWLRAQVSDVAALQRQQSADQTADNLSVSNAVTALRAIGDADWPELVERTNPLMRLLLTLPLFKAEQAGTRDQTLHDIERLARRSGQGESAVAQALLALMREAATGDAPERALASHWLRGPGRAALAQALGLRDPLLPLRRWAAQHLKLPAYLGALALGTALLMGWLLRRHGADGSGLPGGAAGTWALGVLLMLLPASEAVVAVINRLISESARPEPLPRLALAEGIPAEHRVLVAIPALLLSEAGVHELVHRLELHHLANPEAHAQFALVTDWADAATRRTPTDMALLADAKAQVQALAQRYAQDDESAQRFILLHRERQWSDSEQCWIGWERKRGKLLQLVAALAKDDSSAFVALGEASHLAAGTRYLVTLDADTQLPPGSLRELVGVAAHPRNQPQLDTQGRGVAQGYAVLQPRIATPLPAVREMTLFHWLFAGQCGVDPYSAASSEVYQDLFGEGSFMGKGLLNVQAVHALLHQRLPEGQVLSHDLLEGAIARCASVSDITLIENAPFHADVAAARVHRWTRGDWQLLPFLLRPRRYGLSAVNCWKMADNLRRSLVAPLALALLLAALAGRALAPGAALALVLAAFSAGPLIGALAAFAPARGPLALHHFYRRALADLARACCAGLWQLQQLVQHALAALDATGRALYRMVFSRRLLLQWTTAAAAQAASCTRLATLARRHWRAPLAVLLLAAPLLALTRSPALAGTLLLAWGAAPLGIWWVSRPRPARRDEALAADEAAYLQAVAHDSWRWFEACVGPQDHHLPPDNLQTTPQEMLAHRTSPTNIGLYLLAAACARQFGWIDTPELLARLEATLATLSGLQRHRGHFLNWYDTESCAPLQPMYVSTVDSGNLSGHLLAVAQACLALARGPEPPGAPLVQRLLKVAQECERLAWAPDYAFLYHPKRQLFHIGFRVAEQQLDAGFYDLLASEARLTSMLAIAKGDVPVRHWAALGRPYYAVGSRAGLRSWSGSMFEYLMPTLVLDEPHGSVLREAALAALREQMDYATIQGAPWGVSESAYAGADHTLAYQYAPQGVPRLALRRTPVDELVVAPYASALAAQLAPHLACANLRMLEALRARTRHGFIEALDFSPARQQDNSQDGFTPVNAFMAHHQAMIVVALANVLLDGAPRRWGMGNAHVEAVATLLHERTPRQVPTLHRLTAGPTQPPLQRRRVARMRREITPGLFAPEPTHLLSNGRYSVALRANGAGWSRWGGTDITRWRDDALRDAYGSFLYLRWLDASRSASRLRPVSLTQHPAADAQAHYQCVFHADRVSFETQWPGVHAQVTVWVSPEDDVEFRRVELRNQGEHALNLELMSAFEPTLTEARADEAHPAFSNLFLQAQWSGAQQALLFTRRPRAADQAAVHMAHFLADSDKPVASLRLQTDRQRWLGRRHAPARPQALLEQLPQIGAATQASRTLDTGLDPVCALAAHLHLPGGASTQLTFATAASDEAGRLRALIDKYRQPSHVQRASLMSATLAGIRLRELRVSTDNFAAIQTLTSALVQTLAQPQPHTAAPDAQQAGADAVCDRRLLWRLGLSGDKPIVLVFAGVSQGLGLLRALAQALRLWAWGGVACDLVVLNAEPNSYLMALQPDIAGLRDRHLADCGGGCTGFHALRAEELSPGELSTLRVLARLQFNADGRPLRHHVQEWATLHQQALDARNAVASVVLPLARNPVAGTSSPSGQFDSANGEFRFEVSAKLCPPRPWANVLANPVFGTQLTEAGGGHSWAVNSRLNQLTAWSNDPVGDPPSEWLLLQDRKNGRAWSLTPNAWADEDASYRVAHGQGYSVVTHRHEDLDVTVSWCVDAVSAVKQLRVRVSNRGGASRQLRLLALAEWVLGASRGDRASTHTRVLRQALPASGDGQPRKLTGLLCTQREHSAGFGGGTAFLALASHAAEPEDWTCDRGECFDTAGGLLLPDRFGQASGAGLDPCAALATRLLLAPGDSAERVFLLGWGDSPQAAGALALAAAQLPATQRLEQVRQLWEPLLGATHVKTPDLLFDALVNRWLLYQTVACRLWAKAGFYQAGGATGFRDQLQDAMALAWARPQLLREQILVCAARQFREGDVQHWWHAPQGNGVRTHFSDDLLWLPYACLRYLQTSGDTGLLDEQAPFLEGPAVAEGAEDSYHTPVPSSDSASVYEHAALALDRSLRVGAHGLPLMGSGDWNDGMNRVGAQGKGESVWLAWFLCALVQEFAPMAQARGDLIRAKRWHNALAGWQAALNGPAWDGQWFKRAFFDDGSPLGSYANAEARIDLIAQAWAVLSDAATPAMQRMAMTAVEQHLADPQAGLLRLLDPPLQQAQPSAGYIQAYPPGVRENGGQYNHAAVWALMAQVRLALRGGATATAATEAAWRYFTWLSPAHRAAHPQQGPVYGLEPYVMAGDIYSQPPYAGRGGWSWYTGSAAWLHRAAIESLFGLRLQAGMLSFQPCLPSHWPRAELTLTRDGRALRLLLLRSGSLGGAQAVAAQTGARLLQPGEWLDWAMLPPHSNFVLPLLAQDQAGQGGQRDAGTARTARGP